VDAFKSAGIPEDKATAAAKAIAEIGQEERLTLIEKEITEIKGDIKLTAVQNKLKGAFKIGIRPQKHKRSDRIYF